MIKIPGDKIESNSNQEVILGEGIYYCNDTDDLEAVQAGLLHRQQKDGRETVWIDQPTSRTYLQPKIRDPVIGRIVGKTAEVYRVDIGCARLAALGIFEFEGATKRNRPHLRVGQLVYALVKNAHPRNIIEPDLTCINPSTMRSDGFGLLEDGMLVQVPLSVSRYLLANPGGSLLGEIAKEIPFELAIGVNGLVWLKSPSVKESCHVYSALQRISQKDNIHI